MPRRHCRLCLLQEEAHGLRARAALGAAIAKRWERAQLQQHQRHLQDQERGLRDALARTVEDERLEQRAHAELVEYLHQATEVRLSVQMARCQ